MNSSELPSFGTPSWTWAAPSKDRSAEAARVFYNYWLNFVTEKDFSWADMWNESEAPDRRVRRCAFLVQIQHSETLTKRYDIDYRLMERDNKKSREEARKEFNETVRVSVRGTSPTPIGANY